MEPSWKLEDVHTVGRVNERWRFRPSDGELVLARMRALGTSGFSDALMAVRTVGAKPKNVWIENDSS